MPVFPSECVSRPPPPPLCLAIVAIAFSSSTPEERRDTLHMGVSIGVPDRRVPGLNLLVSHVWLCIVDR
jgi:hypothetical protein